LSGTLAAPAWRNNYVLWLWVPAGACHRARRRRGPVAGTTPNFWTRLHH